MNLCFMAERSIENCLEGCLELAKHCLEVYDEMERHNVSYEAMCQALKTGTMLDYCYQRNLKVGTATRASLMTLDDFTENRRSYYEKVVEHLLPIVENQDNGVSLLNPTLTLENYRESNDNSAAIQIAKEVINSPGKRESNPFLLTGASGCGKTHLVNAIGNAIKNNHPVLSVLYVTGSEFKHCYMDAVRSNRLCEFKAQYDKVDVLILDNLLDLVGHGTQDSFFHIMDHLYQKDKQMVFTSSVGLDDMKGSIEERIIEHLRWGKTIGIGKAVGKQIVRQEEK